MNKKIKNSKSIDSDISFRILRILEERPQTTQRELAEKIGISLGGVNYCLKALVNVGHIKINNFRKSSNKCCYFYLLTPEGLSKKSALTADFLKRKMTEYSALKSEIESIQQEFNQTNSQNYQAEYLNNK